jgi:hypothetical protein
MNKILLFGLSIGFCSLAQAQSVSHAICQSYEGIMDSTILSWRQSGQIPIGAAEDVWNSESDARTRVFLKQITREIYRNPNAGQQYIKSGRFLSDCIKTHRGF